MRPADNCSGQSSTLTQPKPGAGRQTGVAQQRAGRRIVDLTWPLLVLVFAATAIPLEMRSFDTIAVSWKFELADFVANLVGYIPVGIVLARFGPGRAIAYAALLTLTAEACQLFALYRFASPFDVALNTVGAMLGVILAGSLQMTPPVFALGKRAAAAATVGALAIFAFGAAAAWKTLVAGKESENLMVNRRGATSVGSLEGHWTFDEPDGNVVIESSGNGVDGMLHGNATREPGTHGGALHFATEDDYVDLGTPISLRLMGAVSVSAWIYAESFPADDAAIVSTHVPGYQLDASKDRGPRTIAFKLVDPCGNLVLRYGRTPLVRDKWYFVAGVFDPAARTIHVYVDGQQDDGFLSGVVPPVQQPSTERVYVGKRPNPEGWGFQGRIDDVRIHSTALNQQQIESLMNRSEIEPRAPDIPDHAARGDIMERITTPSLAGCAAPTQPGDSELPALMMAVGMMTAIAIAAFRPEIRLRSLLLAGLAVGGLFLPAVAVTLPFRALWIIPGMTLAGAAIAACSMRRTG